MTDADLIRADAERIARMPLPDRIRQIHCALDSLVVANHDNLFNSNRALKAESELATLTARLAAVERIGAQFANVAFNWKQGHKRHLAEADFKMLADLQRQWDAARAGTGDAT